MFGTRSGQNGLNRPSVGRAAVAFGAALTVCVAVGTDLLAGERPVHTATLGMVALAVAVIRVRMAGRQSGLFAALSGSLVAQPALHAAAKMMPAAPGEISHATETSISLAHVALAATVVTVVSGAEKAFRMVTSARPLARILALLLLPPVPLYVAPGLPDDTEPLRTRQAFQAELTRRGPPVCLVSLA